MTLASEIYFTLFERLRAFYFDDILQSLDHQLAVLCLTSFHGCYRFSIEQAGADCFYVAEQVEAPYDWFIRVLKFKYSLSESSQTQDPFLLPEFELDDFEYALERIQAPAGTYDTYLSFVADLEFTRPTEPAQGRDGATFLLSKRQSARLDCFYLRTSEVDDVEQIAGIKTFLLAFQGLGLSAESEQALINSLSYLNEKDFDSSNHKKNKRSR